MEENREIQSSVVESYFDRYAKWDAEICKLCDRSKKN